MGVFITYLVKSSLCLAFFYLFNKLLLSKETFHRMNRLVWLLIIPFALLLPFYTFPVQETIGNELLAASPGNMTDLSGINVTAFTPAPVPVAVYYVVRILTYIYFAGVVFFACWLLYNYIQLGRKIHGARKISALIRDDYSEPEKLAASRLAEDMKAIGLNRNIYIILQEEDTIPFSWMNYIFIGERDMKESGKEILRHELSHVRNFHSLDVMLVDLVLVFQWFNPAAWLLKYALQQVHEFQADDAVLVSGVNAREYQLLLIKKAVGQRMFSMVNSFNYSKLKNRILMMSKEKSSRSAYLKYIYALPLAFFVVSAYASNEAGRLFDQVEAGFAENNFNPDTLVVEGKAIGLPAPEYIINGEAMAPVEYGKADENNKEKIMVRTEKQGDVKIETGKPEKAALLAEVAVADDPKEAENVVLSGRVAKDSISMQRMLITIYGDKANAKGMDPEKRPLVIIDGKEGAMESLRPEDIKNISVLKDKSAVSVYGDKAKNGVIIIATKAGTKEKKSHLEGTGTDGAVESDRVVISGRTAMDSMPGMRITISGKANAKGMDPEKMPLVIIDGKEGAMESLRQEDIKSISILKDKSAVSDYGDKAKNGVIIITTKAGKKEKKSHK